MAAIAKQQRDFNSYFLEYQLLNSEQEINAFWLRMEQVLTKMTEKDKKAFFQQFEASMTSSFDVTDTLISQLSAYD